MVGKGHKYSFLSGGVGSVLFLEEGGGFTSEFILR